MSNAMAHALDTLGWLLEETRARAPMLPMP